MMEDTKLSENFWLSEFLRSEMAEREGILNEPAAWQLINLRVSADGMEQVRGVLGHHPIHINSGLRVEALERVIARRGFLNWCGRHGRDPEDEHTWEEYFATKSHPEGLAVDFTCRGFGTPYQICKAIVMSKILFDKLIYEFSWVHISWPAIGMPGRRISMTQQGKGFTEGIQEV